MKNYYKLLCVLFGVLLSTPAFAQPTDIQTFLTVDGNNNERIRGLAVGPADQMYQVGVTNSISVNSGGASIGLSGISQAGFIARTDSSGSTGGLTALSNAVAEDVAVASNGDIYVVGEITGASDLVPGGGFANTPPNTSNAFIWKLDANFNTIWVKTLPVASNEANASTINIDDQDNLYIVGEFSGTVDLDINGTSASPTGQQYTSTAGEDLYILKTDSAANFIKYQVVTGDGNETVTASDISVSADRFAITGFTTSNGMNFSGNNISNFTQASRKNYAAVYDTALTIQLTTNMYFQSSNSQPANLGIAIDDSDGSFAICGYNNLNNLEIRVNNSSTGQTLGTGGYVVKHNADGSYAWQNVISSSNCRLFSLDIDDNSSVYFSGWVPGSGAFGFDASGNFANFNTTGNSNVGNGSRKVGFGVYDKFGRAVWGEIIGSGGNMRASNIVLTDNNHIAISGEYNTSFDAYQLISIPFNGLDIDVFSLLLNADESCISPALASSPPDTAVCFGSAFSYTPTLEFVDANTTYQWYDAETFNPVAGQTSQTFTLANATTDDAGDYYLEATNSCGTATFFSEGDSLTLTVNDTTVVGLFDTTGGCLGNAGHIRPVTITTGTATYEWFKDGALVATQTDNAALAIPNFSAADEGEYVVNVTDACGTDNDTTILSSDQSIYIVQDFPDTFYVCTSANLITVFSTIDTVDVEGTVNGNFQFGSSDWTNVGYGFQVANNPNQLGNQFRVVIRGTCDTVLTNPAILATGTNFPVIDTQPADQTVGDGATASFTVAASAANSFEYQWLKDGTALTDGGNISGATTATLTISNASSADEGDYTVEVTGGCNNQTTASNAATLTVDGCADPAIATQPTGTTVGLNGAHTFEVVATGTNITYQWAKDGTNLADGGNISGATSASLTVSAATAADAGDYTCTISGDCGTPVTTTAVTLVVDTSVIGRPDLSAVGISIYPNPAEGELNIVFENNSNEDLTAVLLDVSGRVVQDWRNLRPSAGTINTLSLEGVAGGMYILELRADTWQAQQRIVVR